MTGVVHPNVIISLLCSVYFSVDLHIVFVLPLHKRAHASGTTGRCAVLLVCPNCVWCMEMLPFFHSSILPCSLFRSSILFFFSSSSKDQRLLGSDKHDAAVRARAVIGRECKLAHLPLCAPKLLAIDGVWMGQRADR